MTELNTGICGAAKEKAPNERAKASAAPCISGVWKTPGTASMRLAKERLASAAATHSSDALPPATTGPARSLRSFDNIGGLRFCV